MNASVVYPVQILQEHLTELEAAITVCLADPDHKPVHKLRTETRRIEALLTLLDLLPDLPEHRKESAAMLRALAKLRRAAGEVRDLDVHRKMLETLAAAKDSEATSSQLESQGAAKQTRKQPRASRAKQVDRAEPSQTDAEGAAEPNSLSQAAAELRKQLGKQREKAAGALQELLKKRQVKTARAAEALLQVLRPAEQLELAAPELLRNAEAVFRRDGLLKKGALSSLGETELHTIRKSAKRTRYLAESLPEDADLAAAARRFEAMQEAGGQWHDALEIARAARRYFGRGHELTAAYRGERDQKLAAYRAALAESAQPGKRNGRTALPAPKKPSTPAAGRSAARKASKAA